MLAVDAGAADFSVLDLDHAVGRGAIAELCVITIMVIFRMVSCQRLQNRFAVGIIQCAGRLVAEQEACDSLASAQLRHAAVRGRRALPESSQAVTEPNMAQNLMRRAVGPLQI